MRTPSRRLAGVVLLALCVVALSRPEPVTAQALSPLQKEFLALVKASKNGVPKAQLDAFRKKHDELESVMGGVFKPTTRKGLGHEATLLLLEKKALAPGVLVARKDELLQLGQAMLVMGELTKGYPVPKKAKRGAREWNKYSNDQKQAALDFLKAVRAGNGAAVQKAATRLNGACFDCHADFRD